MINDTYRQVIQRDSYCAGFHHGDQGHEMDLFRSQFDAPEDFEAFFDGWREGRDHGPHHLAHPNAEAADRAWRAWEAARKGVA
jgi:hypothetical protein